MKSLFFAATHLSAVLLLCISSAALAEDDSNSDNLTIEAQSLASALREFSEQTGLQIGYAAELADGKRTKGVQGVADPSVALDTLLASTGLEHRFVNDETVVVRAATVDSHDQDSPPGKSQPAPTPILMAQNQTPATQTSQNRVTNNNEEEEGARPLEVVTVTARRKEESLNEIPLALTAFGEQQLDDFNVINLYDIGKYVPNLHIGNFGNGNPSHTSVFMRGVGQQDHIITVDSGIGLYLDGVYLGRQQGSNLNMSNIERVEVVRGPQGTLYGRNNIGGAINFITKRPTGEDAVTVSLQAGSRERAKVDFYVASSLSETLFYSVTGQYNRRAGVGEFFNQPNTAVEVGEIREGSIRATFNWVPSEDFSLYLTADLTDGQYGQAPQYFVTEQPGVTFPRGLAAENFAADPYDSASPADHVSPQSSKTYGSSATLEYGINDNYAFKAISSYRRSEYTGGGSNVQDNLGQVIFPELGSADQYSVELQVNGTFDNWDFVAGAFYFNEDGDVDSSPINIFSLPAGRLYLEQEQRSEAVFASASFQVTDRLELTVGGRNTWDEKESGGEAGVVGSTDIPFRSANWSEFTWDVSALYKLTDSLNLYALSSRGYQAGGFPARPFGGPAQFVSYDPQFANNYEVGIKGNVGGRLQMAATLFWTEYTDLQLQVNEFVLEENGFVTFTENAGEAEAKGLELEGTLHLTDAFSLQTSVGYIDIEYTNVGSTVTGTAEGNRPQLTPERTVVVSPTYTAPLSNGRSLTFRATYNYRSDMSGEATNVLLAEIEERDLLSFNIRYQPADPSWNLVIYGDNVLDEKYIVTSGTFGNNFSQTYLNNDRSEFGVRLTKEFGF